MVRSSILVRAASLFWCAPILLPGCLGDPGLSCNRWLVPDTHTHLLPHVPMRALQENLLRAGMGAACDYRVQHPVHGRGKYVRPTRRTRHLGGTLSVSCTRQSLACSCPHYLCGLCAEASDHPVASNHPRAAVVDTAAPTCSCLQDIEDPKVIKKAYRELSKIWHPDKVPCYTRRLACVCPPCFSERRAAETLLAWQIAGVDRRLSTPAWRYQGLCPPCSAASAAE